MRSSRTLTLTLNYSFNIQDRAKVQIFFFALKNELYKVAILVFLLLIMNATWQASNQKILGITSITKQKILFFTNKAVLDKKVCIHATRANNKTWPDNNKTSHNNNRTQQSRIRSILGAKHELKHKIKLTLHTKIQLINTLPLAHKSQTKPASMK